MKNHLMRRSGNAGTAIGLLQLNMDVAFMSVLVMRRVQNLQSLILLRAVVAIAVGIQDTTRLSATQHGTRMATS